MFTPGFRLFFGFTLAGLLAMFVYGVASGDGGGADYLGVVDAEEWTGAISLGWKGGIGDHLGYIVLMLFAVASGFIAVMLVAFRDADPDAVAELAGGELPPAQGQTVPNYWPLVGAFGLGVLVIGLVTHIAIFVVGLLILAGVTFEWMMSAWADRATGDPAANRQLRNRIMCPVELPVVGALGVAAFALAVSRVFLSVSAEWAVWVAVIAAAVIFLGAVAVAVPDKPNKNLVAGVLAFGAIAALAGGVIAASLGERDFEGREQLGVLRVPARQL
ncbi:MAG: hypothetical protein ACC660_04415, partial [Acidimicrobiales bacterium]